MKRLLLKNGRLILPDKILEQGSLLIREGRIAEVLAAGEKSGEMPDEEMNLEGDYLAPGFIDIHVHGGGGGDFMDADEESWRLAMGTHIKHGTTAMCPTTMAASKEELEAVFSLGRELAKSQECWLTYGRTLYCRKYERSAGCFLYKGAGRGAGTGAFSDEQWNFANFNSGTGAARQRYSGQSGERSRDTVICRS